MPSLEETIKPEDLLIFKRRASFMQRLAEKRKEHKEEKQRAAEEKEKSKQVQVQKSTPTPKIEVAAPVPTEEVPETMVVAQPVKPVARPVEQVEMLTKAEEESVNKAKGFTCVNHPWRPAYAVCSYCKRPFCYADLMEYNRSLYCLEDINKVSTGLKVPRKANAFSYLSAMVLFSNAAILLYFTYPQTSYVIDTLFARGLLGVGLLITNYGIALLNTVLVLLGLIAATFIIRPSDRGFLISGMVIALMLMSLSFEYLNSNASYLLITTLISFANMVLLITSKATSLGRYPVEEEAPQNVAWPRIETF